MCVQVDEENVLLLSDLLEVVNVDCLGRSSDRRAGGSVSCSVWSGMGDKPTRLTSSEPSW